MKRNKIIAVILMLVMILSTTVSYAGTGTYTAHYMFDIDNSPESVDFEYSDAWLSAKSTKYNNNLAIASMGLALAAGGDDDTNISQLLTDMGFSKFKSNYATKEAKKDNVCVSYAMKKSGKNIIVPVVVRGSHYADEWVDNFQAGTSGDAKGYSSAAKRVVNYINAYIKNKKISKSKIRLWVVGYSRGAAIADLTAESLTSKYGKARVYGYCFESPMTNKGNGKKANIHHVRNVYDGVTAVLPSYMGFGLAGKVDKKIGTGDEAAMKLALKNVVKEDVDKLYESPKDFCWAKVDTSLSALLGLMSGKITVNKVGSGDQKEFWSLVIKRVKKVIPSRKKYTSVYSSKTTYAAKKLGVKSKTVEASFMGIMKWYLGLNDADKAAIKVKLGSALTQLASVVDVTDLMKLFDTTSGNFSLNNEQYTAAVKAFSYALGGGADLEASIAGGLEVVIKMLDTDFASNQQILGTVLYQDGTGSNLNRLIFPHGLEVTMAWLMAAK